ncbi:MAG TPA: hypothetical protein VHO01_01955 [Jatrophihabitans sp.]|nr:hypothetical protein [Jatrophihabitans sp.]
MFKPSTLLIAVVLSSTALWSGFVTGSMSVTTALIRFLIAVPIAAAMTFALQAITRSYGKASAARQRASAAEDTAPVSLDGSQTVR